MRILILAAGALGGYFGARLVAAGRDVTFLVRPARAALLAAHGLDVLGPHGGDLHLPPPPTVLADTVHNTYDLILFSAKAYDLASALAAVVLAVGPHTAILPMLNGLAHMALLDAHFGPARVLGGRSLISAALDERGTIHHFNARDSLFFAARTECVPPHANLPAITAALSGANFPSKLRPNITQDMWNKWTFLASLAGITCLLRANIAEIAAAGAGPFALALFAETLAIARAEGHPSPPLSIEQRRFVLTHPSPLHASMLRDLEAGNPIESQHIIGNLLARATGHGLAAPILVIAHTHLLAYEARRSQRTPSS